MLDKLPADYSNFKKHYGDPTEELHGAYDSWLDDMASREGTQFVPFEFDLKRYPEQGIYEPKIDAHDPHSHMPDVLYYAGIKMKMVRSLGALAYLRLSDQLNHQPVSADDSSLLTQRLIANQHEGKNTMVVTSHFTFPELGYFKALRFLGKSDRPNIDLGGVLLNKLMTRQSYKGKKIVDHFTPAANVYFSYPKSTSAEKHGVPKGATMLGNALFMKVIKPDLKKGGLELDAALTGKQIVTRKDENGELDHYEIPEVDPSSAKLIEGFDDIFGATIIKSPVTGRFEMRIGDVLDIQELLKTNSTAEIVDSIYADIARSVERFTGKEVDYHELAPRLGKLATDMSGQDND